MNYLYLFNAALLWLIGGFVYFHKRDRLSLILLLSNITLSVWSVCVFSLEMLPWLEAVDLISKVKLATIMMFVFGIFNFCYAYPENNTRKFNTFNCFVLIVITGFLIASNYITRAERVGDEIIYHDNLIGFSIYTVYILTLGLASLAILTINYKKYIDHRSSIKYLLTGLALFTVFGIFCNLVLPSFGVYEYLTLGRLSSIFPPIFFAYVITKHDFMNLEVIINRKTSWVVTIFLICLSYIVLASLHKEEDWVLISSYILLGVFWGSYALPLQNFLLTTAKRKFIRGWYDTDNIISELSEKITVEKDRQSIFTIIDSKLDDVYEVEVSRIILAKRNVNKELSHYIWFERGDAGNAKKIAGDSPMISFLEEQIHPMFIEQCEVSVQQYLDLDGFVGGKQTVLIPFHSPEFLEGVIVLGERSSQGGYTERDMRFFSQLVNYMSAILYRLTPIESLERLYQENKQRLHEAEIQLLRAQKIESIVHATRQCHHEIRTPLNIIRLGIGRIKTIEDLKSYKEMADEEIARAMEVVEETLTITDVTKSEEDRYTYVDVNEVLSRCGRLVDKGLYQLEIKTAELPLVWGIFSDLQVLFTNLIHNAIDVMPDGGSINIESYVEAGLVVVKVEDNGPGIPEDLRSKVWEPYFSGHQTEVGNSNAGRGWGLTIVNRIVTEHEGTIRFTSEIGVGTCFYLSLKEGGKGDEFMDDASH